MTRRNTILIILGIILLAMAAQFVTAQRRSKSGLDEIKQRGTLRVGLDASFPPFETLDADGNVVGLDADIAHAIAADLGVDVEFANIGFDGLYDALTVGRVDVVISGLPIDPFRTRDAAYSTPYFNAGQTLITTRTDVQSVADVAGKTVAVEWGSMAELAARTLRDAAPEVAIVPQPDVESVLAKDLAVVDGVQRLKRPDARTIAVLSDNFYAAAVAPGNRALLAEINRTLAALRAEDTPCGLRVPRGNAAPLAGVERCYAEK